MTWGCGFAPAALGSGTGPAFSGFLARTKLINVPKPPLTSNRAPAIVGFVGLAFPRGAQQLVSAVLAVAAVNSPSGAGAPQSREKEGHSLCSSFFLMKRVASSPQTLNSCFCVCTKTTPTICFSAVFLCRLYELAPAPRSLATDFCPPTHFLVSHHCTGDAPLCHHGDHYRYEHLQVQPHDVSGWSFLVLFMLARFYGTAFLHASFLMEANKARIRVKDPKESGT